MTILPKKQFLTIPLNAIAYGRRGATMQTASKPRFSLGLVKELLQSRRPHCSLRASECLFVQGLGSLTSSGDNALYIAPSRFWMNA